jgi:putative transcriptional regulator
LLIGPNQVRAKVKKTKQNETGFKVGNSIISGVKQAIARAEGKKAAVRRHEIHAHVRLPVMDVRKVRGRLHLSQAAFASRYGLPPASVENWEQGKRKPGSAARILLAVIDKEPEMVARALQAYTR